MTVALSQLVQKKYLEREAEKVFAFATDFLNKVGRNSKNLQLTIKSALASFIESDSQIKTMLDWYDG